MPFHITLVLLIDVSTVGVACGVYLLRVDRKRLTPSEVRNLGSRHTRINSDYDFGIFRKGGPLKWLHFQAYVLVLIAHVVRDESNQSYSIVSSQHRCH